MDLATKYMGLALRSPLIASASPLNGDLGTLRAIEDHGAGAVVLPSIFEEQIVAERHEFVRAAMPSDATARARIAEHPHSARLLSAIRSRGLRRPSAKALSQAIPTCRNSASVRTTWAP